MSLNQLFNMSPTCEIYKLRKRTGPSKFGVPGEIEHYYSETPDYPVVECYFKKLNEEIYQAGPDKKIRQRYKVLFPPEADVSINDKVVWNGMTFYLEAPENKFDKFIQAIAVRDEYL